MSSSPVAVNRGCDQFEICQQSENYNCYDYFLFESVLLVSQITGTGNEMCV